MQCPRCNSKRIQLDFDNAFAVVRLAGLRKVLCNECGNVFHGFDPFRKLGRAPKKRGARSLGRRRSARFSAHLPTSISLIQGTPKENAKVTYSEPSQGHCESINESGMGLSLVGSRFPEAELTRRGRLLFVRVRLPEAAVEAVVTIVNHRRIGEDRKRKWFLGVRIQQITDEDKAILVAYLKQRVEDQPLLVSE
ncbi:MAG TPA: TFIIB-type zinc ribbon-containing protein [Pyrinomonadaceae bacterium]|jgi:hypothetical protein|nr:TFIIB-type zinc ribbon-containing protein [Pyrinomonadaceae bacterium]